MKWLLDLFLKSKLQGETERYLRELARAPSSASRRNASELLAKLRAVAGPKITLGDGLPPTSQITLITSDRFSQYKALTARFDGCQERLAGQVLNQRGAPAARQQIAVHLRQGHGIDGQHRVARRWRLLLASHISIIARQPLLPNMSPQDLQRGHEGQRDGFGQRGAEPGRRWDSPLPGRRPRRLRIVTRATVRRALTVSTT